MKIIMAVDVLDKVTLEKLEKFTLDLANKNLVHWIDCEENFFKEAHNFRENKHE